MILAKREQRNESRVAIMQKSSNEGHERNAIIVACKSAPYWEIEEYLTTQKLCRFCDLKDF